MARADLGRKLAALLVTATLAACARPSPQTSKEAFKLEPFRWRAESTPQALIVATNEWGDLRVRTAQRGGLVVSAMIQKIGTAADELRILIEEAGDRVVVKVEPRVARPRGRVDLTLIIPPGKRLEGATRDGLAEIKYKGDVEARTRGGSILIENPAHASARTETGAINAKLSGNTWTQAQSFTSGSGDITVWLPEDANLVLRTPTGETRWGNGGPELRIDSDHGNVRVVPIPWIVRSESRHLRQPADLDRREALVLGHDHLLGELVPQLGDVGDDADHPASHPQALEGLGDEGERVGIEGAEALVAEQAVQSHGADGALNLIAELQG